MFNTKVNHMYYDHDDVEVPFVLAAPKYFLIVGAFIQILYWNTFCLSRCMPLWYYITVYPIYKHNNYFIYMQINISVENRIRFNLISN